MRKIAAQIVEAGLSGTLIHAKHSERMEPRLHAFCTPAPDDARAAARRVDATVAAGEDPGPLAGVPVGVKDLVCTKDLPTVSGSVAHEGFV